MSLGATLSGDEGNAGSGDTRSSFPGAGCGQDIEGVQSEAVWVSAASPGARGRWLCIRCGRVVSSFLE